MDESKEQWGIVGLVPSGSKEHRLAERKATLLREAEFYRIGIVHARASVKQGARPQALLHQAIDHASWALRARVDALLHPTGINVGAIMPFAVSVLGFITRRRLVKPALGVLVAVAAVALYVRQRRARAAY